MNRLGQDGLARLILHIHVTQSCWAVSQRAAQTLKWVTPQDWLLDIALDHLTLGRAALYEAIFADVGRETRDAEPGGRNAEWEKAKTELDAAVAGLRRAGSQNHLPRGLVTRAWLRALTGARTGPDSAHADLDEAWEIAERGPMRLFLADIHLDRARLFYGEAQYLWKSPQDDLSAAEKLMIDCGYHRRDEELADAKRAILGNT